MAKLKKAEENAEAVQTVQNAVQDALETEGVTVTAETVKLVYVGPQLPRGQLKTNKIFEGGSREEILASPELEPVLKKYPLVARMLVPVSKLAEAKQKVKTAGNALHKFYADIDSLAAAERMEG